MSQDKQFNTIDLSLQKTAWGDFNKASVDAVKKLVPDKLQRRNLAGEFMSVCKLAPLCIIKTSSSSSAGNQQLSEFGVDYCSGLIIAMVRKTVKHRVKGEKQVLWKLAGCLQCFC